MRNLNVLNLLYSKAKLYNAEKQIQSFDRKMCRLKKIVENRRKSDLHQIHTVGPSETRKFDSKVNWAQNCEKVHERQQGIRLYTWTSFE